MAQHVHMLNACSVPLLAASRFSSVNITILRLESNNSTRCPRSVSLKILAMSHNAKGDYCPPANLSEDANLSADGPLSTKIVVRLHNRAALVQHDERWEVLDSTPGTHLLSSIWVLRIASAGCFTASDNLIVLLDDRTTSHA